MNPVDQARMLRENREERDHRILQAARKFRTMTNGDMARMLGVPTGAVVRLRKERGLQRPQGRIVPSFGDQCARLVADEERARAATHAIDFKARTMAQVEKTATRWDPWNNVAKPSKPSGHKTGEPGHSRGRTRKSKWGASNKDKPRPTTNRWNFHQHLPKGGAMPMVNAPMPTSVGIVFDTLRCAAATPPPEQVLEPGCCSWIHGDGPFRPFGNWRWCNRPKGIPGPYCDEHDRLTHPRQA